MENPIKLNAEPSPEVLAPRADSTIVNFEHKGGHVDLPRRDGLTGQGATCGTVAVGDHYDRVIQDLAMKKLEIDRTIIFLRGMQQAAR